VEAIEYGTSQKSSHGAAGVPVLRIPNIAPSGTIDVRDLKYASFSQKDIERYSLKEGDILLIRSNGSLSLVGQAAKVGKEQEGFAFAGYLLRMRPKEGVLSDYLLEVVRSDYFLKMVKASARSSTGINNLSASRLAEFEVPLPSLERQQYILETLAKLEKEISFSVKGLIQTWSCSQILQESARSGWLGQFVVQPSRSADNAEHEEHAEIDYENVGSLQMGKDFEAIVLQRLDAMPNKSASFELLSEGLKIDYEVLRDAVFKLLSARPPIIEQIFDCQTRTIILRHAQ